MEREIVALQTGAQPSASLRKILGAVLALSLLAVAWRSNYLMKIETNPTGALLSLGVGVFCLWTAARLQIGLCVAAGIVLRLLIPAPADYYGGNVISALGLAGFCGFLMLLYWAASGEKEALIRPVLVPALIFTAIGLLLSTLLRFATIMTSRRYDLQIYAMDNTILPSLGPFFGKLLFTHPWALFFEQDVYAALPGVTVIVFAFYTYRRHSLRINLMALFLAIAILGYVPYFVVPACGPFYAFGSAFPFSLPSVHAAALASNIFQSAPNAMPSLHLAGALMLFWNSKPWLALRIGTLIFLTLTIISILGLGEHYVTDLIVAVPFTLALQSIFSRTAGRIIVAAFAAGLVVVWFVVILAVPINDASHWLLWTLAFCSIACPLLPGILAAPNGGPDHSR